MKQINRLRQQEERWDCEQRSVSYRCGRADGAGRSGRVGRGRETCDGEAAGIDKFSGQQPE